MSETLKGKTALVTGGSRGIGRAIAFRLAQDGATVLVHYGKSAQGAEEVVDGIRKSGGKAFAIGADLGSSEGVSRLVAAVEQTLSENNLGPNLDILVNNAGVAEYVSFEDTTEQQFDQMFQVNVKALFFVTKQLINRIPDGGRIINVSSVVSRATFPGIVAYSATKGAVDVFTRHLAAAVGARGITVNAIAPGATDTDMSSWVRSDEGAAMAKSTQALQQVGKPEFVADAVAFLAGPDSRWVTGQIVDASGGAKL